MLFFVSCPKEAPFSKSGFWLPKGDFWGPVLGPGPIRRDGLFVLTRKGKLVFCSRGVPKNQPVRGLCFVHYMHLNICDGPKSQLSLERLFGSVWKFLYDRKNMIFSDFWTPLGLPFGAFCGRVRSVFSSTHIEEKTFFPKSFKNQVPKIDTCFVQEAKYASKLNLPSRKPSRGPKKQFQTRVRVT